MPWLSICWWAYPSSPVVPYTLCGGQKSSVWFDRVAMALEAPEDKTGMGRSVAQVDEEIKALVGAGIPLDRIGVAGFSMGGCLALHVAYGAGDYSGRLGFAACLSSFLAKDSGLWEAATKERGTNPPLFMAHGTADPMIKLAWAEVTAERLQSIVGEPAAPGLRRYDGVSHELCRQEVSDLADFILEKLKA
eukprot:TRINITY_DN28680_c0_g1_i5.p1 TRINITY_DN28680_c0_g1~~TRINITY_DN28680_c0_g1_i5.p1  ORF type:complete len:199 (-),score=27.84 TRINITY_DN28680_c0_g1_i5:22-594(-)